MSTSSASERDSLRLSVLERTTELVTAALSLVAALAWNDAIQSLFKYLFPEGASVYAKFLYALFITALVVLISQRLLKVTRALRSRLDVTNTRVLK